MLVLGAQQQQEIIGAARSKIVGSPSPSSGGDDEGENGGVLHEVAGACESSLQRERLMFLVFIAIYVFVALLGLGIVLFNALRKDERRRPRSRSPNQLSPLAFTATAATSASDGTLSEKGGRIDDLHRQTIPVSKHDQSAYARSEYSWENEKHSAAHEDFCGSGHGYAHADVYDCPDGLGYGYTTRYSRDSTLEWRPAKSQLHDEDLGGGAGVGFAAEAGQSARASSIEQHDSGALRRRTSAAPVLHTRMQSACSPHVHQSSGF